MTKTNKTKMYTTQHKSDTSKTVQEIEQQCKVAPSQLKKFSNPKTLPCTTNDAPQFDIRFGQTRAIHAIDTALDISATGYHIFAVGENGIGKRTLITHYLKQTARCQSGLGKSDPTRSASQTTTLNDWIYVHNFNDPQRPIAISLPNNSAVKLATQLKDIWQALIKALSVQSISSTYSKDTASAYEKTAKMTVSPLFDDLIHSFNLLFNETIHDAENSHNRILTEYLINVKKDMVSHAPLIAHSLGKATIIEGSSALDFDSLNLFKVSDLPSRYTINIMVNHDSAKTDDGHQINRHIQYSKQGSPIVFERDPNCINLLGRIEHITQHGSIIANNKTIQPGALHEANGGYLIIEAARLLDYPDAWHALKRTLQTHQIDLAKAQSMPATLPYSFNVSLKPDSIPLNIKVILLGDPDIYDSFIDLDAEFDAVFKIRADFHDEVKRSLDNEQKMVSKMADVIEKYDLLHFDSSAQAVVLEYLSLLSEDQNKLSLHSDRLIQLLLESSRQAHLSIPEHKTKSDQLVTAVHVKQALADINYRSSYLKELYWQEITDGQQLICTTGKAIGQINALTIIDYAGIDFGMPALLTAVVQHSVGSGDILDIERDVELGGSLHAKGMLIMNSYLRALFSPYHPLNFTASLAFEQSYAHIDGDSATLAEACALLSALAEVPIAQSIAITGSMNQLGMVQAVGGVNAKVAGFFDACVHQGLTGNQGVILPATNISQLMLRDDIIQAVRDKQFHIYGVKTLSDALTILANMPIDTMTKKGRYKKSSLFGKIIKNLQKWEEQLNPIEEDVTGDNTDDNKGINMPI